MFWILKHREFSWYVWGGEDYWCLLGWWWLGGGLGGLSHGGYNIYHWLSVVGKIMYRTNVGYGKEGKKRDSNINLSTILSLLPGNLGMVESSMNIQYYT